MKTAPLHTKFGLIVEDVNLKDVTAEHLYPEIRHAFETQSALLFKNQELDDETHTKIAELFGPLENREAMAAGRNIDFKVSAVSNENGGSVYDA